MSFIRGPDDPGGLVPEIRKNIEERLGWREIQNLRSCSSVLNGEIKYDGSIPDGYKPDVWGPLNYKFLVDLEVYDEGENQGSTPDHRIVRDRELLECMNGYYINDVKWLANFDQKQQQNDKWIMSYRLTEKPKINQIGFVFCLGKEKGVFEKYLPMVCVPMPTGEKDEYDFCEMQLQNDKKKDMLDFLNLVPVRNACFLKKMHRRVSQSYVLKISYENDVVQYLKLSMTGAETKTQRLGLPIIKNHLHSIIDHCSIICNNNLVDFDQKLIVDSFTAWYMDIPIDFPPKEHDSGDGFGGGFLEHQGFGSGLERQYRRNEPVIEYPKFQKAIDERQCNWKNIPDPRRLMYLPLTYQLPLPMPSGVKRPGKHLRDCVIPGLDMRVFNSSRAIANCIYDDLFVHQFGNQYRPIVGTAIFKGESQRAKDNAFKKQKRILEGHNREERKKLRLDHPDANRAEMVAIFEAHGVAKIDLEEAKKNTPEVHIPNIRATTLLLRYNYDGIEKEGPDPSLLVLPSRLLKGESPKPDELKFGRLLRNINGAVHSWPESWWRRMLEFLNSKTFHQSIHNPPFTCNAVLATDINIMGRAGHGIKAKIKQLVGDTVKVYAPLQGNCHMGLDQSCLSLIVTQSKSNLYNLVNIIRQIENHLPTFVKQHGLPDYHGIVEMAIRVEIPSIRAFSKENNGEKLTDLLMEWGQSETQMIDLLCNANENPKKKEKKESGYRAENERKLEEKKEANMKLTEAIRERAKEDLAARAESPDPRSSTSDQESMDDNYLSADEDQYEESMPGSAEADYNAAQYQLSDHLERAMSLGKQRAKKQAKTRKKRQKRKEAAKIKTTDPWAKANGRLRFTLKAKSKEKMEKLLKEVEKYMK